MGNAVIRLLVISYYFPPLGGPGVQRITKFCKYLPQLGIEPTVVSAGSIGLVPYDSTLLSDVQSIAHYPVLPWDWYGWTAKRHFSKEKQNLPKNASLQSVPAKWKRSLRRLFPIDDKIGWYWPAKRMLDRLLQSQTFDAVLVTCPPFSASLLGLHAARKAQLPLIVDMRDPWSHNFYYCSSIWQKWERKIEQKLLRQACRVITVSPGMKRLLESQTDPDKVICIPNGFDREDLPQRPAHPSKTILCMGTLSSEFEPFPFLETLKDQYQKGLLREWNFRFIGSISGEIQAYLQQEPFSHFCSVQTPVSHQEIIQILADASAVISILNRSHPFADVVYSSRLFEYIGLQKPIFAVIPPNGDAANLIREIGAGVIFDGDLITMANQWNVFLNQVEMGNGFYVNGVPERLERSIQTEQLANLIHEAVQSF